MASSFFGALTQGAQFDKKRFQQEIGLFKKHDGTFSTLSLFSHLLPHCS